MAKLPRHAARDLSGVARRVRAAAVAVLAAALASAAGADSTGSGAFAVEDLIGTWHVLVHYKDDNAANPDRERWDDRVWVFERAGDRLRWTEYPIVVFDDESGRFERRDSGQYARILHYWEPSPAQLEDIRDGLQVNDRGSKSKTLRAQDGVWASTSRARPSSASVLTYQELWSLAPAPEGPVFTREDLLSSARAEAMEGRTQYRTREVRAGGAMLVGSFERDGTRHGSFRMTRSGEVGELEGAAKTQSELQQRRLPPPLEGD